MVELCTFTSAVFKQVRHDFFHPNMQNKTDVRTLGDGFKHGSSCWFLLEFSNLIDFLLAFLFRTHYLGTSLSFLWPLAIGHGVCDDAIEDLTSSFSRPLVICFPYQVWLYDGQGPEIPPSHGGWHRIYVSKVNMLCFLLHDNHEMPCPRNLVFRGHIEELKGCRWYVPFPLHDPPQDVWVSQLPVWIGWNKYGDLSRGILLIFFFHKCHWYGLFREGASSNTCICG